MPTRTLCRLVVLIVAMGPAFARPRDIGTEELLARSDAIAIVRLSETSEDLPAVVPADVLEVVKGRLGRHVSISFGPLMSEALWPREAPVKGKTLLVFLEHTQDPEVYAPFGGWGTRAIQPESSRHVKEVLEGFQSWRDLSDERRSDLIRDSLKGDASTQHLALDWLWIDRKIDFDRPVSDRIVEGLVSVLERGRKAEKTNAVAVLGLIATKRKSVITYLVQALDDPDVRAAAIAGLDGSRQAGPGPALDPAADEETNAKALKEWWKQMGSKSSKVKTREQEPLAKRH